ncbi:hypothetical protein Q31b_24360 [Novipirellula aureliae]|uniref:Uncharacterized protein n=1 Tax=Novipirellula aureliae TaxID=2527966 RepID=A0A5C6E615_9BACT|nr:hypothetical protein Q31b_24360 [Novipirellula aureliae]
MIPVTTLYGSEKRAFGLIGSAPGDFTLPVRCFHWTVLLFTSSGNHFRSEDGKWARADPRTLSAR